MTDYEHTFSDGTKYSDSLRLNEAGQVLGYSYRRDYSGQTVWLFNGASTVKIGLIDNEHTRSDGYKFSEADQLGEDGQVRGHSNRYCGQYVDMGKSAWIYDRLTTTNIGLTSSEYTRADGYKYSEHGLANDAGQLTGFSRRYVGSTQVGQDAWFYDPFLKQTHSLRLSTSNDERSYSEINYLSPDGLALGTYILYDEISQYVGQRAFSFSLADGLHDLGSLIGGGLTANGWALLARGIQADGIGQILGYGRPASQATGEMAFLLTPLPPTSTTTATSMAGTFLPGSGVIRLVP